MGKNLIPDKTVAKVKLRIRPGGYDESSQGWTNGYATRSATGSVFLNVEFIVVDGEYSGTKIFSTIGLRSPKGPWWGTKGRIFMRDIVDSANGVQTHDVSSKAIKSRELASFSELDGLEFTACIKKSKNREGKLENTIEEAIVNASSIQLVQPNKLRRKDISAITQSSKFVPEWIK